MRQVVMSHILQANLVMLAMATYEECRHDRIPSWPMARAWVWLVSGALRDFWKIVAARFRCVECDARAELHFSIHMGSLGRGRL